MKDREKALAFIASRVRAEDRGYHSPCLVWQQSLNQNGYAQTDITGFGKARVHRAAYELARGPIPSGLVLDHLCCVRNCCNPEHLEPVTRGDNIKRGNERRGHGVGFAKPRPFRRHCAKGHPLTDRDRADRNRCNECKRIRMAAWRAKRRSA